METPLTGGGVNAVVRVGATVRRPTGAWTPAVHALLAHLARVGFAGAPRPHGIDPQGREILDFVPGVVYEPAPSAPAVAAAGRLLRAYHDATASFRPPPDARWYFPPLAPVEVVCHGDVAPYNTVFRDGLPVAFIDFDTAHPGPRSWDVAYAAYRFVPRFGDFPEWLARASVFCDAYGLPAADRRALGSTLAARLRHLAGHIESRTAAGDAAFAVHLARGDADLYRADAAWAERG